MNKKIYALLLLVFVLVTLSAVSAADVKDNNQTLALDSSSDIVAVSNDDSNALKISNDDEIQQISDSDVLGDGETGSFTELQSLLSGSSDVTLEKDYKYVAGSDSSPVIYVNNHDLVLNGNGHSIDFSSASASSPLIYMGAYHLELSDITLMNGQTNYGSVLECVDLLNKVNLINMNANNIVSCYDQASIQNCNFINNTANNLIFIALVVENNVFLNNTISNYVFNSDGLDVNRLNYNVFINSNNNVYLDYVGQETGNYYSSEGLTITGADKIDADSEYSISLPDSAANVPEFDLLIDIDSKYANVTPSTITLGGGKTATVTVLPKKNGNVTLNVGYGLVSGALGTKDISIELPVPKQEVTISAVYPSNMTVGDSEFINVTVTNKETSNPVENVDIKLTVDKDYVITTDSQGVASLDLSAVPAGIYSVTGGVEDSMCNSSDVISFDLTVNKKPKTKVEIQHTSPSTMTVGDSESIEVKAFYYLTNDRVDNLPIKITVDKNYTVTTSSNGVASLDLSAVPAGTYSVAVAVDDENYELSEDISFNLTVNDVPKETAIWYYNGMDYLDDASISIVEGGSIPGTYAEDESGDFLADGTVVTISLSNGQSFTSVVNDGQGGFDTNLASVGPGEYTITFSGLY